MSYTNTTRITGLNSGMDVDALVEKLMNAESSKYNNLQKRAQKVTWQQEAFRSLISKIQTFQNKWFGSSSSSTNFRYSAAFQNFQNTVMNADGTDSKAITVNSATAAGSYNIDVVQLAQTDTYLSAKGVGKQTISSSKSLKDVADGVTTESPLKFSLNLDGVTKTIEVTADEIASASGSNSGKKLQNVLNEKLKSAFGTDKNGAAKVSLDSNGFKFNVNVDGGSGHTLTIVDQKSREPGSFQTKEMDALDLENIIGNAKNNSGKAYLFTANEKDIEIDVAENDTYESLVTKINTALSDAGLSGFSASLITEDKKDAAGKVIKDDKGNTEKTYKIEFKNNSLTDDISLTTTKTGLFEASDSNPIDGRKFEHTGSLIDMGFTSGDSTAMSTGKVTLGDVLGKDATIKINGKELSFSQTDTLSSVMSKIKDETGVSLTYNAVTEQFKLESGESGSVGTITFGTNQDTKDFLNAFGFSKSVDVSEVTLGDVLGEDAEVTIDGNKLSFNKTDSLESVMSKIEAETGVSLTYNALTEQFKIESGESVDTIKFGNDPKTQDFLNTFGFITGKSDDGSKYTSGQDAVIMVDGVETTRSSNDVNLDGLKITLNKTTVTKDDAGNDVYNPVKVSSAYDTSAMVNKIKDFVKDYNDLISELNSQINTTRSKTGSKGNYSYYEPLTDAEKKEMSDDEIKKWEEEAKKGLLYNDTAIRSLVSNMRSTLYNKVTLSDGKEMALFMMGITTTSDYTQGGKLEINETKLEEAIRTNGDAIKEFFTKAEKGLGDAMKKVLDGAVGSKGTLRNKAGIVGTASVNENSLSKTIKQLNEQIEKEKTRLADKENYYYKLFSNMESAVSKSNNQMDSLYSLLS